MSGWVLPGSTCHGLHRIVCMVVDNNKVGSKGKSSVGIEAGSGGSVIKALRLPDE